MPLRLSVVQRAQLYHTFQTSEQLPDSVCAPSTKHKQQARRTDVLRKDTNRDGIQLCVKTLQMTMTTTQAVNCRRLAGPKKKPQWHVPSTDVKAVTRKNRKKNSPQKYSQAALLGLMRCQHSKLPSAGIVATFVPRQTPQTAQVAIGSSVPSRKILPV